MWPQGKVTAIGIIILAVIAAYGGVIFGDFVRWDDFQLIINNPLITHHSLAIFHTYDPELYVPLTLGTYQIEHLLFGFQPMIFHATNLLLHTLNALLVFSLLGALMKNWMLALSGALLFAVHPLGAEAVAWVSGRKDLLMTTCTLGSLLCYVRCEGKASSLLLWSLLLSLGAMLAKPTAIMLPLLLLACDAARNERVTWQSMKEKWPFWSLSILIGIVAVAGKQDAVSVLTLPQVVLLAAQSCVFYIQKFFLPTSLAIIHPAPTMMTLTSDAIIAITLVIGMIAAAWALRRRLSLLTFGMAFFFIALAPTFLAYQKSNDVILAAERYAYLPMIGLIVVVLSILQRLFRERTTVAFALVASLAFIPLARMQTATWKNSETLFSRALAVEPHAHVAMNNLAFVYMEQKRLPEALVLVQAAVAEKPAYADAWVNMGAILGRMGDIDGAETALDRAIALEPENAETHVNLGGVWSMRGNWGRAEAEYREAVRLKPSLAMAHQRLAVALKNLGRMDEARTSYLAAVALSPALIGSIPGF